MRWQPLPFTVPTITNVGIRGAPPICGYRLPDGPGITLPSPRNAVFFKFSIHYAVSSIAAQSTKHFQPMESSQYIT